MPRLRLIHVARSTQVVSKAPPLVSRWMRSTVLLGSHGPRHSRDHERRTCAAFRVPLPRIGHDVTSCTKPENGRPDQSPPCGVPASGPSGSRRGRARSGGGLISLPAPRSRPRTAQQSGARHRASEERGEYQKCASGRESEPEPAEDRNEDECDCGAQHEELNRPFLGYVGACG